MADETIDQIIARLEGGQATAPTPGSAEETPEQIIARLEGGTRRPEANSWYRELPGQFNESLARALGLIATPITASFLPRQEGVTPSGIYETVDERAGASRDAAVSLFRRLGFIPEGQQAPSTIAGHIGASLPGALTTAGGIAAGAPRIASALSGSSRPGVAAFGELAGSLAARPATTAISVVGSEPGMVAGRETARPYIEGAFPGTDYPLTAAAARSALFFGAELLGGLPSERIARAIIPVPRAERFLPSATAPEPVLPFSSDPDLAGRIAAVRSVNFTDRIDRAIGRAIEMAGEPGLAEGVASRRLREGLLVAREYAERVVDRAYRQVPDDITGNPAAYGRTLEAMAETAREFPGEAHRVPLELIRNHIRQLAKTYDPDGAVIAWRDDVPVWELNRLRSDLIQQMRDASELSTTGSQANRYYKENLDILTNHMTQTISDIGAVNPNFQGLLDYANSLYRGMSDRFFRGPVGDLLINTRAYGKARPGQPQPPGAARTPPTLVARQMLNADETAEAVAQSLQWVRDISPASGLGRAIADGTARTADEAIRVMFAEDIGRHFDAAQAVALKPAAAQGITTTHQLQRGPIAGSLSKAQAWMDDNAPLLNSWVNTTARLFGTVQRMNRLLLARDAHTQSVVAQFMGRPATEVVEQTLRTPDSANRFRLLHRMFRSNSDFLEGIQRALIDSVFAGRGADPNVALARLRQENYREALQALFANDPGKVDRIYQMVRDAADITGVAVSSTTSGQARIVPGIAQDTMSWVDRKKQSLYENVMRLGGLAFGNVLAKTIPLMGSAGSLSIPMRMGRAGRDLVANAWLAKRREALSIIKDAAFNPEFEAYLRNNAPGNFTDLRANHLQLQRWMRRFTAMTNEDVDEAITGRSAELGRQERLADRERLARERRGPYGGR